MTGPALLALDGGGSKVDAALLSASGRILGAARWSGPLSKAEGDGDPLGGVLGGAAAAIRRACADAGVDAGAAPIAELGIYCLAGADLPADDRRILSAVRASGWTEQSVLHNDTFAVLRAGSERNWGVAVVCGYGTNCSGVAPDGRMIRFPAVGTISGDWGGGIDIGMEALWHAVRAEDGRGQPTALAELVPAHFGLTRPVEVTEAMYFNRIPVQRVGELSPIVFQAARGGDAVARTISDRQSDEVVAMAGSVIRRLDLTDQDVDVVLGGGVFRNDYSTFLTRIERGLKGVATRARMVVLSAPPVVGAALLGLDRIDGGSEASGRVRAELTHDRLTADTVEVGEQ